MARDDTKPRRSAVEFAPPADVRVPASRRSVAAAPPMSPRYADAPRAPRRSRMAADAARACAPHRARAPRRARRRPSGRGSPTTSRARSRKRAGPRGARRPAIAYPPELPVAQRADGDRARDPRRIRSSSSAARPGSGKTTQLPKICLAAGRGERGLIGHTQPRRIAARAVATRIAQELGHASSARPSATRSASPTTRGPTRSSS